ncbi:hypothetical protein HAX54_016360 [Datura stramonium]|uniref:RING-type domain-containing protein n=1 Tax=Datura stramonium TaxID=4076 RepID=A0ABS8S295_DATST|nr:hypothetical protein [Datura stramonium]
MWRSISNAITSFGQKKECGEPSQACHECSDDDDVYSNASTEEGLECPICWESFNIVENIPYVLWCGHTLCKHCLLGLKSASWKFSSQQVQIPLFISCPWCNMLTFRLAFNGNLKFPSKNFFLLWMVESRNGDRVKSPSAICRDHQQEWSVRCTSVMGNTTSVMNYRRVHRVGSPGSSTGGYNHTSGTPASQRVHFSLHKSLDFFIRVTSKFPLVIVFLLLVMFAIPSCAAVLALYLLITILFGLPSFLVLYFAYPALEWLIKEITA